MGDKYIFSKTPVIITAMWILNVFRMFSTGEGEDSGTGGLCIKGPPIGDRLPILNSPLI